MSDSGVPGLVIRLQSGFYTVQTEQGIYTCKLRGRLKKRLVWEDLVAVGDHVYLSMAVDGSGVIEEVGPRHHSLVRLDPRPQGDFKQVLLANTDQVVCVFSCTQPEPHLRMLDRFLVISEKQEIPALIVINKIDLMNLDEVKEEYKIYDSLGYPVIYTSTRTGDGIQELVKRLQGKVSALAGPSGVGKSSLLNTIQPSLGLAINEISRAFRKGRHTTVVRQLHALHVGGYVADMPGLRTLALWDVEPEELDGYFPEMRGLVSSCQFSNCSHLTEPGCAVLAAVEDGRIDPCRYESYLRLRFGDEE